MTFARVTALALLAGLVAGAVLVIRRHAREPFAAPPETAGPTGAAGRTEADTPSDRHPWSFHSNNECRSCHEGVWKEMVGDPGEDVRGEAWARSADQHPAAWFNAFFEPDPLRIECSSCHAPLPILQTGLGTEPFVRLDRHEEGVGCIECHRNGDTVEGPLPASPAACQPVENPAFARSDACAPCHAPHGSVEELAGSEWGRKGYACQTCHMPEVERPSATGGPVRPARSHRMLSFRDPDFLRGAVSTRASIDGRLLHVSIENDGTGHRFPGEIYNRRVVLSVRMAGADGTPFSGAGGEDPYAHDEVFKTVPRPQRGSEPDTRIAPFETREFSFDLPPAKGTARVRLVFSDFFLGGGERLVFETEIPFETP
ncbi:MAG: hypothetical protein HY720_07885 [Planctomycetes bacterium]|nr:hypothetical protein [Planctomycetota bacterium]